MDLSKNLGDRGRIARTALAAALAVVAINSLRKGKRLTGALAGVGAVALGYEARTASGELAETIDIDTTSEGGGLRCADCGQPIVPGQRRGPNESGEIVHEDCEEAVQ